MTKKISKQTPKKVNKLSLADKRRLARLKKNIAPTAQNTLMYSELYEEGLMHVVDDIYSKTWRLGSTNYFIVPTNVQQGILEEYNAALNSLAPKNTFQLSMVVSKVPKKVFQEENSFPLRNDEEDVYREEFNALIQANHDAGKNNFKVESFVTLSEKATSIKRANNNLDNLGFSFGNILSNIDVDFELMDGQARLELMNKILRDQPMRGNFKDIAQSSLTTKDLIAPQAFNVSRAFIEVEEKVTETMYVSHFPDELSDEFFKDLTNAGVEMVITIHGRPKSISDTRKNISNQAVDIEGEMGKQQSRNIQRNMSPDLISRTLKESKKEVDGLSDFVKETGDKQFSSLISICVKAENATDLVDELDKVRGVADQHGAILSPLLYLQEEAINSSLPLGKNYIDCEKAYMIDLITPNLAINSPFVSVELQHKGGKFYGVNLLSNQVILINRLGQEMDNGNGFVLGASGVGKSFLIKNEISTTHLLFPDDEIMVLDPEGEYSDICRAFGGELIHISPRSTTNLNILDLADPDLADEEDDPIAIKSNLLLGMFSTLFKSLSDTQESLIDEITSETYERFEGKRTPTLQDWYAILLERDSEEAEDLASKMPLYVSGSQNMFAQETNVDLQKNFLTFNLKQLKHKMKVFGFVTVLDQVWNRILENHARGVRTWVYLDEVQTAISKNQPQVLREAIADFYARARKYGGIITAITQSAERVFETEEGRSMFFNSEFRVLLKQKGRVLDMLEEEMRLTPQLTKYLRKAKRGSGLIAAGETIVPFNNPIPKDTRLYRLFQTDPRGRK